MMFKIKNIIKRIYWHIPLNYTFKKKLVDFVKKIFIKNSERSYNSYCEEIKINDNSKIQLEYIKQIVNMPNSEKTDFVKLNEDNFKLIKNDPKLIAYYLPQYYPFKENDIWWGKGVTEWNNVSRAVPQFVGQYQPRFPGELGYYDLRVKENMERQIQLAKDYGIYAFCFYYYWFDGKRLLDKPLDMFLKNKDMKFNFCLCWANENWTRRFDGTNSEILMSVGTTEDSYANFLNDIITYTLDERYIMVDGKPVIIIYRPSLVPNANNVISNWRKHYFEITGRDLYIIGIKEYVYNVNLINQGYDAISEFQPGSVLFDLNEQNSNMEFIRKDFKGKIYDYKDIINNSKKLHKPNCEKLYKAVMPMWDNTARKNNAGIIFNNSTPLLYEEWLISSIRDTIENDELSEKFVFINAWNEWGEGAYLEPDKKYGYAYLQATRNAIEKCRIID